MYLKQSCQTKDFKQPWLSKFCIFDRECGKKGFYSSLISQQFSLDLQTIYVCDV